MLSNAYFLAKFRFDTAENEPAKNLQNFRKMHFRKMHFSNMHFSNPLCPRSQVPLRARDPYAAAPSVLSQSGFCSSAVTGFMLTASEPRFSASVLSACVTSAGADQL